MPATVESDRRFVYVAGPYSADSHVAVQKNVNVAMDAGVILLDMGHNPFVPHLTHYLELRSVEHDIDISYDEWLSYDIDWLKQCDTLLYLDSSPGADAELELAHELDMDVIEHPDELQPVDAPRQL
jgi:hypothetical protein